MTVQNFMRKIASSILAVSANDADFISKAKEVMQMLDNVSNATFETRGKAKRLTGLSYLASTDSSAKIVKGQKKDYKTLVLYLAAADMSGFNICPQATEGCKNACLVASGRARMISSGQKVNQITWARLKKTWLFMFNRQFFNAWLNAEIHAAKALAKKAGQNFAVRLNGTSDLPITNFKLDNEFLLDIHSDVQFYDYTKVRKQLDNAAKFANYDVTFSFANSTEHNNYANALTALAMGQKISVVFDKKSFGGELPTTFLGYAVADGDETDLTFLQDKQVLALWLKKVINDQSNNDFIITKDMYENMHRACA